VLKETLKPRVLRPLEFHEEEGRKARFVNKQFKELDSMNT
jgi:hypothetical protein